MHTNIFNKQFLLNRICFKIFNDVFVLGADIIIDPVGAPYWEKHSKCVAMDAHVLHIGFVSK